MARGFNENDAVRFASYTSWIRIKQIEGSTFHYIIKIVRRYTVFVCVSIFFYF